MHWFAIISSFLLIPPVGIGVAELARDAGWVYVAAVHVGVFDVFLGEVAMLGARDEGDGGAEEVVG